MGNAFDPLMSRLFPIAIYAAFALVSQVGCSKTRAPAPPASPFLAHPERLQAWPERASWDAMWSSNPGHILVKSDVARTIYVAPVNTQYVNFDLDPKSAPKLSPEDIQKMSTHLQKSFIEAIQKHPDTNLTVVENRDHANFVLEIALTELSKTVVAGNVIADVGAALVPGGKVVEQAAIMGAQAGSGYLSEGKIAIELKISDRTGKEIYAEAKDRESDPMSILPNYRDFESFGWSSKTTEDWANQFVQLFETSADEKVAGSSSISILPW